MKLYYGHFLMTTILVICLLCHPSGGVRRQPRHRMTPGGYGWRFQPTQNPLEERQYVPTDDELNEDWSEDVCLTEECTQAAARLLSNMDLTADPCHDFYQFACGRYAENNPIPPTQHSIDAFSEMTARTNEAIRAMLEEEDQPGAASREWRMAKEYYSSCLNVGEETSYEYLWSTFQRLGIPLAGFVDVDVDVDVTTDALSDILLNFMADSGLFGFDLGMAGNSTTLFIYPPTIPAVYGLHLDDVLSIRLYKLAETMRAEMKEKNIPGTVGDSDLQRTIAKFVKVQETLVDLKSSREEELAEVTVGNLTMIMSLAVDRVDIAGVIRHIYKKVIGHEPVDSDVVLVSDASYLVSLPSVLQLLSPRVILEHLTLREVLKLMESTAIGHDFYQQLNMALTGLSPISREKECVDETMKVFTTKISQKWIRANNGTSIRIKALRMVAELKDAFHQLINETIWMDADTKAFALRKLRAMETLNVYDGDLSEENIGRKYQYLDGITTDKTFLQNQFTANQWFLSAYLSNISSSETADLGDPRNLQFNTMLVNAMHLPSMNLNWFPMGIWGFPLQKDHRLEVLNYGASGSITGHELTHGFDGYGSQFDDHGNLKKWWSKKTWEEFKSKQQCFIDQYSKYSFPDLKVPEGYEGRLSVDGKQTLNENIADNGGIKEAWIAYKARMKRVEQSGRPYQTRLPGLMKFKSNELFFLSYASIWCHNIDDIAFLSQLENDEHAPGQARVWGTLSNLPEFANTFGCKKGDAMVNEKRCKIW